MARTHARRTSPFRFPSPLLLFGVAAVLALACSHASARGIRRSIAAAAAPGPNSSGSQVLAKLVRFLNTSRSPTGYSTFLSSLRGTNLPSTIVRAINNKTKFTLLAPTNAAFAAYRPLLCGATVQQVLSHHVVRGYYPPDVIVRKFNNAASKKTIALLPALYIPVGILAVKPKVVLGSSKFNNATVVAPMAYNDSTIAVHGISRVLYAIPVANLAASAAALAANAVGSDGQGVACVGPKSAEAGLP